MTIKLNIGLLIFTLCINLILAGVTYILPPAVTANFPAWANPSYIATVVVHLSFPTTPTSEDIADDNILTALVNMVINIGNMITSVFGAIAAFIIFYMMSGFFLISIMPIWIAFPLGTILAALNILSVIDIILVLRGLFNL